MQLQQEDSPDFEVPKLTVDKGIFRRKMPSAGAASAAVGADGAAGAAGAEGGGAGDGHGKFYIFYFNARVDWVAMLCAIGRLFSRYAISST